MSDSWYSAPLLGDPGERGRRIRRGAGLALVFAGVLATGAATGAWNDGVRTPAGSGPAAGAAGRGAVSASLRSARGQGPGPDGAAERGAGGEDAEELVSRSGDRWSAAYTAREYEGLQQTLDGRYVGVGVSVRAGYDQHGRPLIKAARVQPGSPAARAGVRPGDRLRAIDGSDVSDRPVTDVVARLRGRSAGDGPGSAVRLDLERGERQWEVTLRRTRLVADAVTVDRVGDATRIKVSSFTKGAGAQVRDAVARSASHAGGILLDLRGNSGGLVTEAATAASAFLDGGLIATYDEDGSQHALYADPHAAGSRGDGSQDTGGAARSGAPGAGRPLVVLVDGGTMSAAELLTGALQDRGRAVVVGSRTFGKGSMQVPHRMPDGSVAELTVGHYATPAGHAVDGRGITPDLPVSGPDRAVQEARTVLSGLQARS